MDTTESVETSGLSLEDVEHVTVFLEPGTAIVRVTSLYPTFDPGAAILMMENAIAQLKLIDRLNYREEMAEKARKSSGPNLLLPTK